MGYVLRCVCNFFVVVYDKLFGKDNKIIWETHVGAIYYLTSEVIANL